MRVLEIYSGIRVPQIIAKELGLTKLSQKQNCAILGTRYLRLVRAFDP